MRIGICGPSGTGKTTLAKHLSEMLEIPYKPLSATMVLEEMGIDMGIKGMGHRWLINNSSKNEEWGLQVQDRILESRRATIENMNDVIIDRTPVDNLVYAMYEVSHNSTEKWVEDYRKRCHDFFMTFDLIIFVPWTSTQGDIEDNGSRIPNRYFQQLISGIFQQQLKLLMEYPATDGRLRPHVITLSMWNFDARVAAVKQTLSKIRWQKRG